MIMVPIFTTVVRFKQMIGRTDWYNDWDSTRLQCSDVYIEVDSLLAKLHYLPSTGLEFIQRQYEDLLLVQHS